MSFYSINSTGSIPIKNPKPAIFSWFAAQLFCYKEPMDTIFTILENMETSNVEELQINIGRHLDNRDSKLAKAVEHLYEIIRTECETQENVVRIRYHEKIVIDKLETLTNLLFDYHEIGKKPVRNRKNSIHRLDIIDTMSELLVFIFQNKHIFTKFIANTFLSNNLFTNYENSNIDSASANEFEGSFGNMEGGYHKTRRAIRKKQRTRRIHQKSRSS